MIAHLKERINRALRRGAPQNEPQDEPQLFGGMSKDEYLRKQREFVNAHQGDSRARHAEYAVRKRGGGLQGELGFNDDENKGDIPPQAGESDELSEAMSAGEPDEVMSGNREVIPPEAKD